MKFRPLSLTLFSVSAVLILARPVLAQTDTMFPDVPKNHWAYESVKALKEMGILEGYPAEPKRGKNRTTEARPTFHAPALAASSLETAFRDVPGDHWAYVSLTTLQQRGYLEGYPAVYFRGKRTLTRYEIGIALKRILDKQFGTHAAPTKSPAAKDRVLLLELLDEFRVELRALSSEDGKNIARYEQRLLP